MYTIEKYIDNIFLLTNSLVIKMLDTAIAMNRGVEQKYNIVVQPDKYEWKYFLNISGEKHFSNNDVLVYVKELDSKQPLTKDLINTYESLKNELLKQSTLYATLHLEYPEDSLYINGVMFPADIDRAIEAQDGTILNYNHTLVEDNEISLISKLNGMIKDYLARWHIREYTIVDELYLASLLAALYAAIPGYISSLRVGKILTSEVHSFHLEHFFRSHLCIWDDIQVLNNQSRIWLYNNIKYLIKNIGKDKTLRLVIDKLFTPNKIGVGEYLLFKDDITISKLEAIPYDEPRYVLPETKFITKNINDYYINNADIIHDVFNVVSAEMNSDPMLNTNILESANIDYANIVKEETVILRANVQQTKLLDIEVPILFKLYGTDIAQIVIDNLIYNVYNHNYESKIVFVDPNTRLAYPVTYKQGVVLLMKFLMGAVGNTGSITNYRYHKVINKDITLADMTEYGVRTISPDDNEYIFSKLHNAIPNDLDISIPYNIPNYLDKCIDYFITTNILSSNVNNATLTANIKAVNNLVLNRGMIDLTDGYGESTPDELLARDNIAITINGSYNYNASIIDLLYVMTGINVDIYRNINKTIDSYIGILNKLSSYSTQTIKKPEDSDYLYSKYNSISVNSPSKGIITIVDAEIVSPLEMVDSDVEGTGNNFEDAINSFFDFGEITVTNLTDEVNQRRVDNEGFGNNFSEFVVGNFSLSGVKIINLTDSVNQQRSDLDVTVATNYEDALHEIGSMFNRVRVDNISNEINQTPIELSVGDATNFKENSIYTSLFNRIKIELY